jgi:transcriptional antiterminator NusG
MSEGYPYRAWYVIYAYPGHEEKLRDGLRRRLDAAGLLGQLFDMIVPARGQDPVSLVEDGKENILYPPLFPGAVFVLMAMSDEAWQVIRQTPGLTGFVGTGNRPQAYRFERTRDSTGQSNVSPATTPPAQPGDKIHILAGPFHDFQAVVIEMDLERARLRAMIDFFTRPTPVLLDFNQVEKI